MRRVRSSTVLRVLALAVVVAAGTGWAVTSHGAHTVGARVSAGPTSGLTANIWVSPGGDDSSSGCKRSAQRVPQPAGTACASLARAYGSSAAGDVIGVAAGSYPPQTICRDGTACEGNPSRGSAPVRFVCATRLACTINGELTLGDDNGSVSGAAPSDVTFDGFTVAQGKIMVWGVSDVADKGSHITFENGHVWDLSNRASDAPSSPGDDYGALQFIGQSYVSVLHTEIGPMCCSADGINQGNVDDEVGSHYTIANNDIHDLYDTCNAVPASITSSYGPCTGFGYGDDQQSGAHVDGIQLWGGINGVTIARNRIYSIGDTGTSSGQGIFIERNPTSLPDVTFNNILIVNNMVNMGENATNAISIVPNGGSLGATGFLDILYNTVWASGSSGYGNIRIYNGFMAPGTTVAVVGNISRNYGTSSNDCSLTAQDSSSLPVFYADNLFGDMRCSATDRRASPSFVSTDEADPDLHLAGPQALVVGPVNPYCPARDIDNDPRPVGKVCDRGADQLVAPPKATPHSKPKTKKGGRG